MKNGQKSHLNDKNGMCPLKQARVHAVRQITGLNEVRLKIQTNVNDKNQMLFTFGNLFCKLQDAFG